MKVDVYHLSCETGAGPVLVLVPEGRALPAAGLPEHGAATRLGSFVLGGVPRTGLDVAGAREEIDSRGFHICPPGTGLGESLDPGRAPRGDPGTRDGGTR